MVSSPFFPMNFPPVGFSLTFFFLYPNNKTRKLNWGHPRALSAFAPQLFFCHSLKALGFFSKEVYVVFFWITHWRLWWRFWSICGRDCAIVTLPRKRAYVEKLEGTEDFCVFGMKQTMFHISYHLGKNMTWKFALFLPSSTKEGGCNEIFHA